MIVTHSEPLIGICLGCMHTGNCSLRRAQHAPIWHCEEYCCGTDGVECPKPPALEPLAAGRQEIPNLKGLCINCENRFDCRFPNREDGVWHCAEYC